MPIYEYECRKCSHTFEALVQNGDRAECPACHARDLEQLLSIPARPVASAAAGPCSADPRLRPCGNMCRNALPN